MTKEELLARLLVERNSPIPKPVPNGCASGPTRQWSLHELSTDVSHEYPQVNAQVSPPVPQIGPQAADGISPGPLDSENESATKDSW